MNKRKREEGSDKKSQKDDKENLEELEEAIEENLLIDEEKSSSSEGEGDDLMENMEKYFTIKLLVTIK